MSKLVSVCLRTPILYVRYPFIVFLNLCIDKIVELFEEQIIEQA